MDVAVGAVREPPYTEAHRHAGITFVANSSIDRLTVAWSTSPSGLQ